MLYECGRSLEKCIKSINNMRNFYGKANVQIKNLRTRKTRTLLLLIHQYDILKVPLLLLWPVQDSILYFIRSSSNRNHWKIACSFCFIYFYRYVRFVSGYPRTVNTQQSRRTSTTFLYQGIYTYTYFLCYKKVCATNTTKPPFNLLPLSGKLNVCCSRN